MSKIYGWSKTIGKEGWKPVEESLFQLLCSPEHPGRYFLYRGNLSPEKRKKDIIERGKIIDGRLFMETTPIAANFAKTAMECKDTTHIISPQEDEAYIIFQGKGIIIKSKDKDYIRCNVDINPNHLKLHDAPGYCDYISTGTFDQLREDLNNSGFEILEKGEEELSVSFQVRVNELLESKEK